MGGSNSMTMNFTTADCNSYNILLDISPGDSIDLGGLGEKDADD